MSVVTVVEAYIFAALKHALPQEFEDGTVVATVPQFPGVIAYGMDVHDCAPELYRLLEETIRVWLRRGYELPIIDGIDLNADKDQVLATYHRPALADETGENFFEDEAALERAFDARSTTL